MTTQERPTEIPTKIDPLKILKRLKFIGEIRQVRGEYAVLGAHDRPPFKIKIGSELQATSVEAELLQVMGDFHFSATNAPKEGAEPADETPFVQIKATFVIHYVLDEGETPTNDEARLFAVSNGAFNLHPYWREFVRDCLGRAGLPPYQIPLLNPHRIVKEAQTRHLPERGRDET